jgi:hypothetical protein
MSVRKAEATINGSPSLVLRDSTSLRFADLTQKRWGLYAASLERQSADGRPCWSCEVTFSDPDLTSAHTSSTSADLRGVE